MLRRSLRSAFAAGAYVFAGGAVDPDDGDAPLEGLEEPGGGGQAAVPDRFRVAAIRESFEEAGVLLARDASSGAPVDAAAVEPAREALRRGDRTFAQIVRALAVRLDTAPLRPTAQFITPPAPPPPLYTPFFAPPPP